MKLSRHAKDRMVERCGLNLRSLDKMASTAYDKGIHHRECTGRLKKYVDYLFLSHNKGNNIRLYGDNVYIFHNSTLCTVLKLPNAHKNAVNKLSKRKVNMLNSTPP